MGIGLYVGISRLYWEYCDMEVLAFICDMDDCRCVLVSGLMKSRTYDCHIFQVSDGYWLMNR